MFFIHPTGYIGSLRLMILFSEDLESDVSKVPTPGTGTVPKGKFIGRTVFCRRPKACLSRLFVKLFT